MWYGSHCFFVIWIIIRYYLLSFIIIQNHYIILIIITIVISILSIQTSIYVHLVLVNQLTQEMCEMVNWSQCWDWTTVEKRRKSTLNIQLNPFRVAFNLWVQLILWWHLWRCLLHNTTVLNFWPLRLISWKSFKWHILFRIGTKIQAHIFNCLLVF